MSVKAQSTISLASVKTVNDASQFAVQQAGIAKASADNASEYASRALGNLATVQSVTETLAWITQHGTMTLTTDTALDPTHVYFVLDPNGDYTVGSNTYSIVTEPSVDSLSSYYELTIDESLNNYVGTHLALTSEGLWLLPASTNANKVLIATGAGTTYTTAGTYLIDSNNDVVASFRANGVTIGRENYGHVEISDTGMVVRANEDGSAVSSVNSYMSSQGLNVGDGSSNANINMASSATISATHYSATNANIGAFGVDTLKTDGTNADEASAVLSVTAPNDSAHVEVAVINANSANSETAIVMESDSIQWNAQTLSMVVETGTSGIWTYRKWSDGTAECWGRQSVASRTYAVNGYYNVTGAPPSGLFVNPSNPTLSASGALTGVVHSSIGFTFASHSAIQTYLINRNTASVTTDGWVCWYLIGKWK